MIVNIDLDSPVAIYEQLKAQIIRGIFTGALETGEQLPSVRQLSADLGINMHTVNKVYKILENEGFLSINKKKGAFINLEINRLKANYDKEQLEQELELKLMIYKAIGGSSREMETMVSKLR